MMLGKFDDKYDKNTLDGEKDIFMNIETYKKLLRIISRFRGRLIITPAIVYESLNHMFEAIENKYGYSLDKKEIEELFAIFLQSEVNIFSEKHPLIKDMFKHEWIDKTKNHKIRDRFEIGELSIFVESDKCKYTTIITNDAFKINKNGESYVPKDTLIIQVGNIALS
ncbi:MAG: hypothetical protein KAU20_01035 [Nanoarchaeota archaeon]|nr:hypothetical protein [Nanoarchaeota archaeon]